MLFVEQAVNQSINKFGGTSIDRHSFLMILEFLEQHPGQLSLRGKKINVDTFEYYLKLSDCFFKARAKIEGPKPPETIPDNMVSYILEMFFNYSKLETEKIKIEHQHSMAAENMIGFLLEKYIGTTLENYGWAWCSGDFIRAIDVIKKNPDGSWYLLQIKNRDNTENSSSSAIRSGTMIQKWFRGFSKKKGTNWEAFPDAETRHLLSEDGFKEFVRNYLLKAKELSHCM